MTAKRRLLVSVDEAVVVTKQHKTPCSDCPWRREAVPGWLGGLSPEEWIRAAHGDEAIECHTRKSPKFLVQCAGAATYRANVLKRVRPDGFRFLNIIPLELPKNKKLVFARHTEFLEHHRKSPRLFLDAKKARG